MSLQPVAATADGTSCQHCGDKAADRSDRGDEPEEIEDELNGRGHEALVHQALDDAQHVAVPHLGNLVVTLDDRLCLLVHEVGTNILQNKVGKEAGDDAAEDIQQDAEHPDAGKLGESVILDELASLEVIDDYRCSQHQQEEDEAQRCKPVGKD